MKRPAIACLGFNNSNADPPYIKVTNSIVPNSVVSVFTLNQVLAPPTNQQTDQISIASYSADNEVYD